MVYKKYIVPFYLTQFAPEIAIVTPLVRSQGERIVKCRTLFPAGSSVTTAWPGVMSTLEAQACVHMF